MSSSDEKLRQAIQALKKDKDRDVDVTRRVPRMKLHESMSVPPGDVKFSLTGSEVEFLMSLLVRVHSTLIQNIKDQATDSDSRQASYSMALSAEKLYDTVWTQLGLGRADRDDLH